MKRYIHWLNTLDIQAGRAESNHEAAEQVVTGYDSLIEAIHREVRVREDAGRPVSYPGVKDWKGLLSGARDYLHQSASCLDTARRSLKRSDLNGASQDVETCRYSTVMAVMRVAQADSNTSVVAELKELLS